MTTLKLQIPKKLERLVTVPKRFKIVYGGRGSAKSQSITDILIMGAQVHGWKVGCFREYQNSIDDSVYALLEEEIKRLKAPGYKLHNNKIDNSSGGKFRFKGLSRNPDAIKSMFGFHRFWTEEAQSISKPSLKLLTPTLRTDDSELLFSLNLMSSADPMSERFIEPFKDILDRDGYYEDDIHMIIKMNYTDNPWFPASLEAERAWDYNNIPRNLYDHIWLGEYNDDIEGSIILSEWFDACIDAHKHLGFEPVGKRIASHDPSDEGKDDKSFIVRHGSVILEAETMGTGDSNDGMLWALNKAIDANCDQFNWDCDGLGVSLKAQVKKALSGKKIDWRMFKGSEGPDRPDEYYDGDSGADKEKKGDKDKRRTNKQVFRNKRAQFYWNLRDRCYNTWRAREKGEYIDPEKMISFSSEIRHLAKLKSEVCRLPRKYNANGLIQIMSKVEMSSARFKLPSPNLSDGVMMSLFIGKDDTVYDGKIPGSGRKGSWQSM